MPSTRFWAALAAVAFALLLAGPATGLVSASGTPTAAPKTADVGHPVHIHDGTCAKLGAVVYPLGNLVAPKAGASTPAAKVATPAAAMKEILATSTTTVKVALKTLEKTPFAINAHESMAKITNYIACGDIKGAITNGKLTVNLAQLNKSGLEGDAVLTDNGNNTTTIVINLSKAA